MILFGIVYTNSSIITDKDVMFWDWILWILHLVILIISCACGVYFYGKALDSALLERQTSTLDRDSSTQL